MKTIKVSEATGPALDWLVAKCEGKGIEFDTPHDPWLTVDGIADQPLHSFTPSTDWSQGGPIIEREQIRLDPRESAWHAQVWSDDFTEVRYCSTPLIAAMRCYVASKLGDTTEVPEELL